LRSDQDDQFLQEIDSSGRRRSCCFSGDETPDDSDSFPLAPLYGLDELAGSSDLE